VNPSRQLIAAYLRVDEADIEAAET